MAALALAGCVDTLPNVQLAQGDVRTALAPVQKTGSGKVTVAIASLDGAPEAVAARFNSSFAKAAGSRDITIAAAADASYLIRGYLSAAAAEGGTTVTYVYDVFDVRDQQRISRVSDVLTAPGSGEDAWATVDDHVIASLAGRSADALAAALAGAPGLAATADATPPSGRSVD